MKFFFCFFFSRSTFDKLIRPNEAIMKLIVEKAHSRIIEANLIDSNQKKVEKLRDHLTFPEIFLPKKKY